MEKKLKHLEFIQNAINRMANNSFIIKGWCITLAVALIALLEKEDINKCYIAFSFLPLLFFWFLDAYFIKVERQYRKLYDEVRKEEDEKILKEGAEYVAENYAWEAATWFWTKYKKIDKEIINNKIGVDKVSKLVNGGDELIDERRKAYRECCEEIK